MLVLRLLLLFLVITQQQEITEVYPDIKTQQEILCDYFEFLFPDTQRTNECKNFTNFDSDDYKQVNPIYRYFVSNDTGVLGIRTYTVPLNISTLWTNLSFVSEIQTLHVSGNFDSPISNFTNLKKIHLVGDGDSESIYDNLNNLDLTKLTKLNYINFKYNKYLEGTIPYIGHLSNLTILILSYSPISGTLPSQISLLQKLRNIEFEECNLIGSIPDIGYSLPYLEVLYLQGNNLTGTIPNFLNQQALRKINLSGNNLVGTIPLITYTSNLDELNLSNNDLIGIIPTPLAVCLPKITTYDLSGNNNISGNILCNITGKSYNLDGVQICNCTKDGFPVCPPEIYPANCAVPCDNFTTMGCKGNEKIFYTDTLLSDSISPGEYIILGNLTINNTVGFNDGSLTISEDLNVLPNSVIELQNTSLTINGNLILGENSTTKIVNSQPIVVILCAYLKGSLQVTLPPEYANKKEGEIIFIYTNCTSGEFDSTDILNPLANTCSMNSTQVKRPTSFGIQFEFILCEKPPDRDDLIIGLSIGIPVFFVVATLIFLYCYCRRLN